MASALKIQMLVQDYQKELKELQKRMYWLVQSRL